VQHDADLGQASVLMGWLSTTCWRLMVSPAAVQASATSRELTEPYRLPDSPA